MRAFGLIAIFKKSVTFTVKYQQLWLSDCYREKYGSNILGFTELFKFTVKKIISVTDTMLNYSVNSLYLQKPTAIC